MKMCLTVICPEKADSSIYQKVPSVCTKRCDIKCAPRAIVDSSVYQEPRDSSSALTHALLAEIFLMADLVNWGAFPIIASRLCCTTVFVST